MFKYAEQKALITAIFLTIFLIACGKNNTDKTNYANNLSSQSNFADYKVNYIFTGDDTTAEFCEYLLSRFPQHASQLVLSIENEDFTPNTHIPKTSNLLNNLSSKFESLEWIKVGADRKKDIYLKTVPHKLKEYTRDGSIKNVSVTTVRKWETLFPRESKKFDFWESHIKGSEYTLYLKTAFGASHPVWDTEQTVVNHKGEVIALAALRIHLEFEQIPLDQAPDANAVIRTKNNGKLFFIRSYPDSRYENSLGLIIARAFHPNLPPGARPYEINHPRGPRNISGPLRHVSDDGCQYSLSRGTDNP